VWWHQHGGGAEAVHSDGASLRAAAPDHPLHSTLVDRRDSGNQIEYDEQLPLIDELFATECKRHGVTSSAAPLPT
jgi:hypothetical protein